MVNPSCFPRDAAKFPIEDAVVAGCLDPGVPADALFDSARRAGLATIPIEQRRGRFCHAIGEIAEAVAEVCLVEFGYELIGEVGGTGKQGVDVILMDPTGERLIAAEVKGTLRPGRWPRPSKGRLRQMSREWLDRSDNPGMAEWDLRSKDIYGALVCVNLADLCFRVGFTNDFKRFTPVEHPDQLINLSWLSNSTLD